MAADFTVFPISRIASHFGGGVGVADGEGNKINLQYPPSHPLPRELSGRESLCNSRVKRERQIVE